MRLARIDDLHDDAVKARLAEILNVMKVIRSSSSLVVPSEIERGTKLKVWAELQESHNFMSSYRCATPEDP